jgi:hypothetical protein
MSRRADAVMPHRYPADPADLGSDLRCREYPTETGFRDLAEFDLDRMYRVRRDGGTQAVEVESPVGVTCPEVATPELPDQFTPLLVVGRNATLTGVVEAAAPWLRAEIAWDESAPKLIADSLITNVGRKASARQRAAPRTFATGIVYWLS